MKRKSKSTKRKQGKRAQRHSTHTSGQAAVYRTSCGDVEVETVVVPMDEGFAMASIHIDARQQMAGQVLDLVRQNLKSRRLDVASDYLDLVLMIHPQSAEAMLLRGELARAQGNQILADVCKELAPCL